MLIARRFFICCVAIRCNNLLLQRIVPCQKEITTYAKHHPTEDFRLNAVAEKSKYRLFLLKAAVKVQDSKAFFVFQAQDIQGERSTQISFHQARSSGLD